MLESFLFYSGFYLADALLAQAKLTNTADLIRLIIRDEAVHGYYIGYKFQRGLELVDEASRRTSGVYVRPALRAVRERGRVHDSLYGELGLTEDVRSSCTSTPTALMNLGYEALFPRRTPT